jgi:L-lactate dehydrogenase complex protein LldG
MDPATFIDGLSRRLGRPAAPPPLELSAPARPEITAEERLRLFIERLEALAVTTATVATLGAARAEVERLLGDRSWQTIACPGRLAWPAVAGRRVDDLAGADFGLSEARWGVAETGTVVVASGGDERRGYSLLPAAVGFFVRASAIVQGVGDVLRAMSAEETTGNAACVTFISGPSATADIAGIRVTGVHGPREVFVWVIADDASS